MATQVQFRGGSSTEHSSFTGAAREVTVDTTKDTVVVHDGSTAGGHALAKENNPTFTGNVGIGTTNPQAKLDVNGSITAAGNVDSDGFFRSNRSTGNATFVSQEGGSTKAIMLAEGDLRLGGSNPSNAPDANIRLNGVDGSITAAGSFLSTNSSYGFTSNATSFPFTAESTLGNGGKAFYAKHTGSGSSSRYLFYGENNAGEVFNVAADGSITAAGIVEAFRFINSTTSADPWLKGINSSGTETFNVTKDGSINAAGRVNAGSSASPVVSNFALAAYNNDPGGNAAIYGSNFGGGRLLDLRAGNDSRVSIENDGSITAAGSASFDGNVGIGTASPSAKLAVSDSGNNGIELSPTFNSGQSILTSYNRSTSNYTDITISANQHIFTEGNTERMRIDSSGRLLVGTSTALAAAPPGLSTAPTLVVANSLGGVVGLYRKDTSIANGNGLGGIFWYGNDTTSNTPADLAGIACFADGDHAAGDNPTRLTFSTTADGASSPTEAFNIRQNGELESDPTYANTTAGAANVHITSTGFFARSTSSQKYKTNIETLEDSYADAILDIRPVWYRSTCVKDNSDHAWWGFIAEEVAAVDPRLVQWKTVEVSYDEDGKAVKTPCDPEPDGVAYERFVPHLLNLIKRQQSAIETLEQRLTDAGIA